MKNSNVQSSRCQPDMVELHSDEQRSIYGGGDIVNDIGYSIGFLAGCIVSSIEELGKPAIPAKTFLRYFI